MVDTYPDFKDFWRSAKNRGVEEQIQLWVEQYMAKYPELLSLQVSAYAEEGYSWRKIAREYVFQKLPKLIDKIELSYRGVHDYLPEATGTFSRLSRAEMNIIFVIYVGIGVGAGWATEYRGKPAVLLGLENIADLDWFSEKDVKGLIIHELAHLLHAKVRNITPRQLSELENDPLFILYSEGFAVAVEHIALGEIWRAADNRDWVGWCRENVSFLAREYLKRVETNSDVNIFFGNWLNIAGKSHTGYFLGYKFIRELLGEGKSLEEIAGMDSTEVKKKIREFLSRLAGRK